MQTGLPLEAHFIGRTYPLISVTGVSVHSDIVILKADRPCAHPATPDRIDWFKVVLLMEVKVPKLLSIKEASESESESGGSESGSGESSGESSSEEDGEEGEDEVAVPAMWGDYRKKQCVGELSRRGPHVHLSRGGGVFLGVFTNVEFCGVLRRWEDSRHEIVDAVPCLSIGMCSSLQVRCV